MRHVTQDSTTFSSSISTSRNLACKIVTVGPQILKSRLVPKVLGIRAFAATYPAVDMDKVGVHTP